MRRAAVLLCLLCIPLVQRELDRRLPSVRKQDASLYLWSGAQVRRLAPGFEGLLADVYWLRTVQYFGSQRAFSSGQEYPLLGPLLDITTTLDPRLEIAYRYGAIFLSEPPPHGAGKPKEGIALLERGIQEMPRNWRLWQDLGFYTFLFLNDPHKASQILEQASTFEDAPFWLETMAADILVHSGERSTSRKIWERVRDQSEGSIKHNAVIQLLKLDTMDEADRLTAVVAQFARATGRRPASLEELRSAGLLSQSPVDLAGIPFEYDRNTGKVSISPKSPLSTPEPEASPE